MRRRKQPTKHNSWLFVETSHSCLYLLPAGYIFPFFFFCSVLEAWESRGGGTRGGCCLHPLRQSRAEIVFSSALPFHKTPSALASLLSIPLSQFWLLVGESDQSSYSKSEDTMGNSLVVQVAGLWALTNKSAGSIPGQGAEILQTVPQGKKKKKKRMLKKTKVRIL